MFLKLKITKKYQFFKCYKIIKNIEVIKDLLNLRITFDIMLDLKPEYDNKNKLQF